ncbi:5'-3' exoribonuclease 1 [Geodia barretti]|uniref:5'-3' exoribonuclease 1 n=1 Tax=Geodia barretti TaxID=519541 RepID=A0AA35RIM8_GEOBA|nr:5'-3' exoribonuclease 1 [Geodia barretti]
MYVHYFTLQILSVDQAQVRVQVKVRLLPEPDIAGVVSNSHRLSVRYLPSYLVAQKLGLNSLLLSRISGNIQVEKGSPENAKEREKISIGLNLKFERRNKEMPGYCRRTTEGWAYSPAAIGLVKSYVKEFPAVFSYLQGNPKADKYYESELMPANAEDGVTLAKVQEWLKKQPTTGISTVDCGGQSLDEPQIAAVERAVSNMKKQKTKSVKVARLRVKPSVLFLVAPPSSLPPFLTLSFLSSPLLLPLSLIFFPSHNYVLTFYTSRSSFSSSLFSPIPTFCQSASLKDMSCLFLYTSASFISLLLSFGQINRI